MAAHLTPDRLDGYSARTLTAAELLAADAHLATCAACRERLRPLEGLDAAFADLRAQLESADAEARHLRYEELALHLDGALDAGAREVMESHLAICPRCSSDIEDLRSLGSELASRTAPAPAAPSRSLRHARPMSRWIFAASAAAATVVLAWLFDRSPGYERPPSAQGETRPESRSAPSVLPPRAASRVTLDDGGRRVTLDGAGRVEGLPALSGDVEAAVRRALEDQRVDPPPLLARLIGARATLLGPAGGPAFSVSSPVGTMVAEDRPTLRWNALPGADGQSVAVFDADLRPVAESPLLRGTEWRVPKALVRGRTYSWQVAATRDGREILAPGAAGAEARFRILSSAEADALASARREYAGSHLVLGVVYARAGLLDDAERELRALARANPDAPVAGRLLRHVESLRASSPGEHIGQDPSPTTTKPAQ